MLSSIGRGRDRLVVRSAAHHNAQLRWNWIRAKFSVYPPPCGVFPKGLGFGGVRLGWGGVHWAGSSPWCPPKNNGAWFWLCVRHYHCCDRLTSSAWHHTLLNWVSLRWDLPARQNSLPGCLSVPNLSPLF